MKTKILRFLFLPFGFLYKIVELSVDGSRDIVNKIRFKNAIIDSKCSINVNTEISAKTHILENCVINNSKISSYSYVGRNCIIQNVTIGSFCSIANDVFIGLGKHPVDYFSTSTLFYRINNTLNIKLINNDYEFEEYERIEIGSDVWIGTRAIILDGVKIGDGAIIAANSVVTKDVAPYSIVGGVPARIIKYRFNSDKIDKLLQLQWWNLSLSEIKKLIDKLNNL